MVFILEERYQTSLLASKMCAVRIPNCRRPRMLLRRFKSSERMYYPYTPYHDTEENEFLVLASVQIGVYIFKCP